MDHIIYGEGDQSQRKCKVALICYDRATHWLDSFPAVTNDTMCTKQALVEFYGGTLKPKKMYSDNAPELLKACSELEYPHDTSTPHTPQSNGVSERIVRKIKEGAKCVCRCSLVCTLFCGVGQCVVIVFFSIFVKNVFHKKAVRG